MQATLAIVICCGMSSMADAATPTITSVSGSVTTGQIMTISGTDMVQENPANWDDYFADHPNSYGFEGASIAADGYHGLGVGGGTYVSDVKLMGNKSAKFHSQGAWPAGPGGLGDYVAVNPEGTQGDAGDIWVRFYCRWNLLGGSWPSNYMKIIDSQGGPINQYYLDMAGTASGRQPSDFNATYDSAPHNVGIPGGDLKNNRWYTIELHWKTTTPRSYQLWVDGVPLLNASPAMNSTVNYLLFGIINLAGTTSSFSLDSWFDGLAFGASRVYPSSTIEISGDGTTWKYQEPVYLSDTSSQIRVDLSGLSGTNYQLRVTNNPQQTSAIYYFGAAAQDAGIPADASAPQGPDASIPGSDAARPDAAGLPGAVTDLAIVAITASSATLSFTEVGDGAGQPASYVIRVSRSPLDWGTAMEVSQGTCSVPMVGQSIGASRSCTVEGLSAATGYEFQLVAFRGTLRVDAVFGPLSNVAQGTTAASGGNLDAGSADADEPGLDASTCVAGAVCSSTDGCQTGTIDCLSGQPQCGNWANLADGTACQGSNVCYSGACRACPAQDPCSTADGCRLGETSCATGEAVCEDLEPAPNGTACGAQGACHDGACSVCPAGEACTSLDGCQVGAIDCSQMPAFCGAYTNRPDGVACSGGVCKEGICRPCTPGAACHPAEQCKLGAIACATGEPVCETTGDLADGTLCTGGSCHAGRCEPLALTDAGNPCGAGMRLEPSSGRCVADAALPDAGPAVLVEVGCGCAAGASAPASLMLLTGLLGMSLRRRLRRTGVGG